MLALFDNLSFSEVLVGGLIAVVMFGKNLPQAAAKAAVQFQRFKRQMGDLRKEMGIDEQIREAERAMRDALAEAERQAVAAERATHQLEQEARLELSAPLEAVALAEQAARAPLADEGAALDSTSAATGVTPSAPVPESAAPAEPASLEPSPTLDVTDPAAPSVPTPSVGGTAGFG